MEQENNSQNIIIYNTPDGKASVSLYAKDGMVWMNQNELALLFDTSVPNISMHISNILKEGELAPDSVVKNYLSTAADGNEWRNQQQIAEYFLSPLREILVTAHQRC